MNSDPELFVTNANDTAKQAFVKAPDGVVLQIGTISPVGTGGEPVVPLPTEQQLQQWLATAGV